jgi:hypothetical protein
MGKRIPVDQLQWFAFVHAETDLEALQEAYAHMPESAAIYADRLQQIRAYRLKRWGQTTFEAQTKDCDTVDVATLMNAPNREFGSPDSGSGKHE